MWKYASMYGSFCSATFHSGRNTKLWFLTGTGHRSKANIYSEWKERLLELFNFTLSVSISHTTSSSATVSPTAVEIKGWQSEYKYRGLSTSWWGWANKWTDRNLWITEREEITLLSNVDIYWKKLFLQIAHWTFLYRPKQVLPQPEYGTSKDWYYTINDFILCTSKIKF